MAAIIVVVARYQAVTAVIVIENEEYAISIWLLTIGCVFKQENEL